MMKYLNYIFVLFISFSCNQNTVKSRYTERELNLLANNPDYIKEYKDTTFVLAAFKAVNLDTTLFKNTIFIEKNSHRNSESISDGNIIDSLLVNKYGYTFIELSEKDIVSKYDITGYDSIWYKTKRNSAFFSLYNILIPRIERRYNNNHRENIKFKAFLEEREISFIKFIKEVKSKSHKKEKDYKNSPYCFCENKDFENITRLNPMKEKCDEYIWGFCSFPNECTEKEKSFYIQAEFEVLLKKIDTSGLFPFCVVYDTTGKVKEIKTRENKINIELVKYINSYKSSFGKILLPNKKPLEIEMYFDYPTWFSSTAP